jgi:hypothetical protein
MRKVLKTLQAINIEGRNGAICWHIFNIKIKKQITFNANY